MVPRNPQTHTPVPALIQSHHPHTGGSRTEQVARSTDLQLHVFGAPQATLPQVVTPPLRLRRPKPLPKARGEVTKEGAGAEHRVGTAPQQGQRWALLRQAFQELASAP